MPLVNAGSRAGEPDTYICSADSLPGLCCQHSLDLHRLYRNKGIQCTQSCHIYIEYVGLFHAFIKQTGNFHF